MNKLKMAENNGAETTDENRRLRDRRKINSPAWADPGGVLPVIDCKIIDLSDDGARIAVKGDMELPDLFALQIDNSRILGEARVIWRTENIVGVKLLRRN